MMQWISLLLLLPLPLAVAPPPAMINRFRW